MLIPRALFGRKYLHTHVPPTAWRSTAGQSTNWKFPEQVWNIHRSIVMPSGWATLRCKDWSSPQISPYKHTAATRKLLCRKARAVVTSHNRSAIFMVGWAALRWKTDPVYNKMFSSKVYFLCPTFLVVITQQTCRCISHCYQHQEAVCRK